MENAAAEQIAPPTADGYGLSSDQLAMRMSGIGGSEIAAIAGLSKWASPIDIYLRKVGAADDVIPTHHMERGTYLEAGIVHWYVHRTRATNIQRPGTKRSKEFPIALYTPDAIVYRPDLAAHVLLEIKSPSRHTAHEWGDPGTDQIPDAYRCQVQWGMGILGLPVAHVVALIDGDIQIYPIKFCERLFRALVERAASFWAHHVQKKIPPPADGSTSFSDYLTNQFPQNFSDMLLTDDDRVTQMAHAYQHHQKQVEAAEAALRHVRQQLEQVIGTHDGVVGAFGKIYWRCNKDSERVDKKALVAHLQGSHPDLVKQYTKTVHGPRVFRTYLKGAP